MPKGVDVTIGEKDGYTPMHGAGFQGRAKIGQLLISHGIGKRNFCFKISPLDGYQ